MAGIFVEGLFSTGNTHGTQPQPTNFAPGESATSVAPNTPEPQTTSSGSGVSTTTNLLFSTPTSSFSETSSAATAGPAVTSTSSPIAASSRKGGLSTGAKAGIAVGAVVGFALLLLLAFFLLKSRKKKQQAPLLADESKSLGVGPSTMSHQDPYSDTPEHAPAQNNRFSWAQPATAMTAVPPVSQSQRYSSGQPATRDIPSEEAAAGGYWQPSASHSPVSAQARKPSDVTAHSRTSMQEARAPPSPVGHSSYTAYNPARQSVAAAPASRNSQRLMDDDWDEDEARLDAEIAEIERMKQVREDRAAMR